MPHWRRRLSGLSWPFRPRVPNPGPQLLWRILIFSIRPAKQRIKARPQVRRLKALSDFLREQLAGSSKLELVKLPCEASQCTATDPGFEQLAQQAKQAGARFVVIGIVKKTSTLIGWIKYSVLRVDDQRAVCGELITYRGDTDESWRRAAKFSAGQIVNRCQFGA